MDNTEKNESKAFRAWSVAKEINLNVLAELCSLNRRYTWDQPLTLNAELLERLLRVRCSQGSIALVFAYGSIVTVNGEDVWVHALYRYLGENKLCAPLADWRSFTDDFVLHEEPDALENYADDSASFPSLAPALIDMTAVILAKSVALERTEAQLSRILETAEGIIDRLENGRILMSERRLAVLTARTLRHEYDSISYILILDKPDATWSNAQAAEYYEKLSNIFELADRHEIIRQKTETLRHIIDGFAAINHSIRGLFVEWIIVLLIVVEIVLMALEYLK